MGKIDEALRGLGGERGVYGVGDRQMREEGRMGEIGR